MLTVTDVGIAERITGVDIRRLVTQRLSEICEGETYDRNRHGQLIVVEVGDNVATLERESGCPIVHSFFNDTRFGDSEFSPSFEVLEEHPSCYEMVFILNDDGFGVLIFVPKHPHIDRELLSLCRTFAVKPR